MSDENQTCTKVIRVDDGRDHQGRLMSHHEKCGAPAAEYEIGGLLTKTKAVLCVRHKLAAERENFISDRGYQKGKIQKKDDDPRQIKLPGAGEA